MTVDAPSIPDGVRETAIGFIKLLMTRRGRMIVMLVSLAAVVVGVGLLELTRG
jgi:hypothetical protein